MQALQEHAIRAPRNRADVRESARVRLSKLFQEFTPAPRLLLLIRTLALARSPFADECIQSLCCKARQQPENSKESDSEFSKPTRAGVQLGEKCSCGNSLNC